jgi:hypothetical protein
MSYAAEIGRENPSCICFLIDQSGSMVEPIAGVEPPQQKAAFLADAINHILESLVLRCNKGEEIRDYFDVVAIGYGAGVGPLFGGNLAGREIVTIAELGNSPARVENRAKKVSDGVGGLVEQQVKFPIWLDATAAGQTPMCEAFRLLHPILARWTEGHRTSFPPVVLHFTDGESTDGDPSDLAQNLKSLGTGDGSVLLFNVHVSKSGGSSIVFPASEQGLPDQFSQLLFRASSSLPPKMVTEAKNLGIAVVEGARGFVYNAKGEQVIGMLEIGTRPANLR